MIPKGKQRKAVCAQLQCEYKQRQN